MERANRIKGYIFVIASAVIFGSMPLMSSFLYADGMNAISLVFLRNLMALPVLGVLALLTQKTLRVPVKALPSMGLIGVLGCCLTPLLLCGSYTRIASGTSTVFHFIYPAVVVLLGVIFLRERVRAGNLLCALICLVGICLFYTPGTALDPVGSVMALSSGVTYAIYILLLPRFRYHRITGFLFSFYVIGISTLIMGAVCLLSGQLALPGSWMGWGLCLVFALTVTVGAVVLFQQGTFLIGAQHASILSTLEPITSIFLGVLVLGEPIGVLTIVGACLVILASILIAVFDGRKR